MTLLSSLLKLSEQNDTKSCIDYVCVCVWLSTHCVRMCVRLSGSTLCMGVCVCLAEYSLCMYVCVCI